MSVECEFLRWSQEEIVSHRHNSSRGGDWKIIWVFVPAVYSLMLLGKSEKRVSKSSKKQQGGLGILIAFVLLNFFFTIFIGLIFNHCLAGGNLREMAIIMGNSFKHIEWKYMILFLIGMVLFYFFMKHESKKDNIDDIKKELKDTGSIKSGDNFRK